MHKDLKNFVRKMPVEKDEGGSHTLFFLKIKGTYVGKFGISRGSKEKKVPPYVYKQLKMSKKLFHEVADCFKDIEEVEQFYTEKGIVKSDPD